MAGLGAPALVPLLLIGGAVRRLRGVGRGAAVVATFCTGALGISWFLVERVALASG